MPSYSKAHPEVYELASTIVSEFHETLKEHKVRIDFVFAYPDLDETTGEPINDALKHNGVRALGIAKKTSGKDRAKGLGDAEITLDGYWWEHHDEHERKALLDHELHHLVATADRDNLGRPIIKMRKHDFQFGWFKIIAARHGQFSQERQQAAELMVDSGQYFWPEITGALSQKSNKSSRVQNLEMTNA